MDRHSLDVHAMRASLRADKNRARRAVVVIFCVLLIMGGHWIAPTHTYHMIMLHVILQMLFVIPTVLAAVWFGFRGALLTAALITLLYVPHILFQWAGNIPENINQYASLTTIWIIAVVVGTLMQREKRALQVLARTHEGALIALVSALDAREHNTQLHSLRVRAFALRLGMAMGMPDKGLTILGEGALLHDIGKIGVPDHVLLKEGFLSDVEWMLMRKHPEIGCHILESVPFLRNAAQMVYAHHEKYDGTGYPRGLSGDMIVPEARIFAVADALDALTCDRPYRKGVDFATARTLIEKDGDTHFDPKVVAALLSISAKEWERIAQEASEVIRFLATDKTKESSPHIGAPLRSDSRVLGSPGS